MEKTTMFMNLSNRGRILGVALALTVIIPASMASAQSRGGRGGGGGNGGGDGGGDSLVRSLVIAAPDHPERKITYIKKDGGCEIRTCEIENGVRKCSTDLTDIKVCGTKRG